MDNITILLWRVIFFVLIVSVLFQLKWVNENLADIGNGVAAISKQVRNSSNAY